MATITNFPFVEHIEDEAMALLLEARNALSGPAVPRDAHTDPAGRLVTVQRNFEVTTRLMWVVSWVFYQKAVRAGELTREEARASLPLLALSRDPASGEAAQMSTALQDRLDRSRALYDRAAVFAADATCTP